MTRTGARSWRVQRDQSVFGQAREVPLETFRQDAGPAQEFVERCRAVEERQEATLGDREAVTRRGEFGIAGSGSRAEGGGIERHGHPTGAGSESACNRRATRAERFRYHPLDRVPEPAGDR